MDSRDNWFSEFPHTSSGNRWTDTGNSLGNDKGLNTSPLSRKKTFTQGGVFPYVSRSGKSPSLAHNQTKPRNKMKKLAFSLLVGAALAATSFAGQEIVSGKDKKVVVPPTTCFNDRELQIDIFGAYADGHALTHAGPVRDHGWGGGVGVNYFFNRYVGIGADAFWLSAKHNAAAPGTTDESTVFHNVDGSVIFRLPIDSMCLAPYGFLGGGAEFDGQSWGYGFVGVGLEYRVVPAKVGLFIDSRWNYYGDRYDHGDQNNFAFRAGVRWVF